MTTRALLILLVGGMLASCGDDSSAGEETARRTTTTAPQTTTTSTVTADSTTSTVQSFVVIEDVVYHGDDERFREGTGVLDIYQPESGGPWPVVVVFHGDPLFVQKTWTRPMAEDLASRGRLVITPTWGRTTGEFRIDAPLRNQWDALTEELRCAVGFSFEQAAAYGGDPDRLTITGYSAGGNAALMAALSDIEPLESCEATDPIPTPAALVAMEADVLLGDPGWDTALADTPEAFYSMAPWRDLSDADDFPVHILAAEVVWSVYQRPIGTEPYESFLSDRHVDIDLVADLEAMGVIDDGVFDMLDAQRWAFLAFEAAGYEVHWAVLPGTRHATAYEPKWGMSDEAWELAVQTVLNAEAPLSD